MYFLDHIWLIPLFPAVGAACMFFFGRKLSKSAINGICVGMVALAFLWTCAAVWQYTGYSASGRCTEMMPFPQRAQVRAK